MSHVTVIDIQIKDLGCLRQAAEELGLEFHEGQKTFRWYGRHVGDYKVPAGFKAEDMGKCDHAIGLPGNGQSGEAYELGVVARRDGKTGYQLMWDFFMGGYGLEKVVGKDCSKLCQGYAQKTVLKSIQPLKAKGWSQLATKNVNGEITITLVRG